MRRLWAVAREHRVAAVSLVGAFLLGVVAGFAALALQPEVRGTLGPGTVSVDPELRGSGTVVDLPPLGRIRADTHSGPVGFNVRVDRIDLDRAGVLAGNLASGADPGDGLRGEIEDDLRPMLRRLAWQSLLLAGTGGLLAGLVLPRRRVRYLAASTTGAVAAVTVTGAMAFASFSPESFDRPSFDGTLEAAPDVINTVQRHIDDVDVVESRLEALSARLVDLYHTVEGSEPSTADAVILHVSDLHSNPVGIELVEETAERFEVDAIIDTGDLTSFGADIEQAVADRIARIDVPYHVVPGNHDHPRIRQALDEAGVSVLDPGVVQIGGVRILGVGEPTFTADNRVSRDHWAHELEASAAQVQDLVRRYRPDVVAVHNRKQLRDALGQFAVGLGGHYHRPELTYEGGSVVVQAGSAGATGVGALMQDEDLPYQMQLLQFEDERLVAVDRLEFSGTAGAFRLERVLIDVDRVAAYPDEALVPVESGPFGPLYRLTPGPG